MIRPPRFLDRVLRLAAAAGALAVISSNPAAFTLMAIAVVVAVSASCWWSSWLSSAEGRGSPLPSRC